MSLNLFLLSPLPFSVSYVISSVMLVVLLTMKIDFTTKFEQGGKTYRRYEDDPTDRIQERVKTHYYNQHVNQTVDFVEQMHKKWLSFTHSKMTILECLEVLADFLDESDPDVDEANMIHAYQTAERLRAAHPDKPWLHLTGLIHDLGKVMSVWGEEQWAVTGDTYPVGCLPADSIVYGSKSFEGNPDVKNEKYNTELGIYKEGCGMENLIMTWSHDEYMYQVLVNHGCTLPDEALYAIRFHSFYPYHTHGSYKLFENSRDRQMMPAVMMLNECDLYSKNDQRPDISGLKDYYQKLIDLYIPGIVAW
uniref:Inositol oxygenase n=1 Tax=Heterorhabditis bacteriophora TaxID=37862 RepID=A0A1I7XRK5_HETBA